MVHQLGDILLLGTIIHLGSKLKIKERLLITTTETDDGSQIAISLFLPLSLKLDSGVAISLVFISHHTVASVSTTEKEERQSLQKKEKRICHKGIRDPMQTYSAKHCDVQTV
ncbi:hypothetical protein CBL_08570 [Carabus blaptoides fortunei]